MRKNDLKQFATKFFYAWYNSEGTNTEQGFDDWWDELRDKIYKSLDELDVGYFKFKKKLSEDLDLPIDIISVVLKEMKDEGIIFISPIFSESTGKAAGSGYGLVDKNSHNKTLPDVSPRGITTEDYIEAIKEKWDWVGECKFYKNVLVVETDFVDDPLDPCKNDDDCCDQARELGEEICGEFPELEIANYYCHRHKYSIVELKGIDFNLK